MTKDWSVLIARRLLLGLALLVWMPASHAWLTTYHVGFLLGDGSQESTDRDIELALDRGDWPGVNVDFDESSQISKFYGGFYFTPSFGLQLEYIDLGKVNISASGSVPVGDEQEFANAMLDAQPNSGKGVALSVIGRFPISSNFVVQDWVGIFVWENDLNLNLNNRQFSASNSGVDFAVGVALEYLLSDTVTARIEWERFNQDGDGINIFGAGMTYYFGY